MSGPMIEYLMEVLRLHDVEEAAFEELVESEYRSGGQVVTYGVLDFISDDPTTLRVPDYCDWPVRDYRSDDVVIPVGETFEWPDNWVSSDYLRDSIGLTFPTDDRGMSPTLCDALRELVWNNVEEVRGILNVQR